MATKPGKTDIDSVSAQLIKPLRGGQWAFLKLFSGAVMISFSGVWVNLSDVTPTVSAFYRVILGSLFLVAAAGIRSEIRWLGTRHAALGFLCGLFFALDLDQAAIGPINGCRIDIQQTGYPATCFPQHE